MSFNIDEEDSNLDQFDIDVEGGAGYRTIGERESFPEKISRHLQHFYIFCSHLHLGTIVKIVGGIATAVLFLIVFIASFSEDTNEGSDPEKSPSDPLLPSHGGNNNLAKMDLNGLFGGDYYLHEQQIKFIDVEFEKEQHEPEITERDDDHDESDESDDENDDKNDDDHEDDKKDHKEKEGDGKPSESDDNHDTTADPGYYLSQDGSNYIIKKASDDAFKHHLIDLSALTYQSVPLNPSLVDMTKDLKKLIVVTESKAQWRHSSSGIYWIVDRNTLEAQPIYSIDEKPQKLYYAKLSPNGDYVYFNFKGNLFLKSIEKGKITQVTQDGDDSLIFNGKSDWVYEEEVLATDKAIWWSPDGKQFAYIRWDESNVPVYNLEFFKYDKYPSVDSLKYPKPGYPNPTVSLHVYNIEKSKLIKIKQPWEDNSELQQLGDDFIIYQAVWLNDDQLMFKTTDRTSRIVHFNSFDAKSKISTMIRSLDTNTYGGWYKNNGQIYILPNNKGFVDSIVVDGHDHLAYYKSIDDLNPSLLSSGNLDVIDGVLGSNGNEVFFIGTHGNALQRQIYKSDLESSTLTALTDLDSIHSYSLNISPSGNWGVLKYNGPELPSQKLINFNEYITDSSYLSNQPELSNANELNSKLNTYSIPLKTYLQIEVEEGITLDVVEIKPKNFNPKFSYPLLVSVYGGPGSQKVNCDFTYGFEEIVSSSLEAIVLYIDPRGTGGRGWDYQAWAKSHIGHWEPRDIVSATENYANEREFVDINKIAIWGWSYGGFTTLKTLEFDAGRVFSFGMAVAPVTNWALYDSIYTERYMGLPKDNLDGYNDAMITNFTNFSKLNRFLIIHGTGDDNVHFQNTLQLLNSFDLNNVENYDMHVYPDSDHSIHYDNANPMVYGRLFNWLEKAFQ